MALKISKNSGLTDVVSTGDNSNPISTQHPITGSTVEQKLYLFNNDATKYYQNVNIDPTDAVSTDESTWVFLAPDNAGVAGTYGAAGAALTMANIGAAGSGDTTGKPFWMKVVSPSGQSVQNKTDIKLTVNYREFAV
ncbi:hypothetical protein [Neobacillus niacini]|uniref:hypothetical protein n=1 Tax=Neobacillus niacini TaxID=86668 RepID=UPI00286295B6|nr:hypothetical protein [Neobacillus niacini]MDR7001543.1 hypothetical protein [Neobacillus niacini]